MIAIILHLKHTRAFHMIKSQLSNVIIDKEFLKLWCVIVYTATTAST